MQSPFSTSVPIPGRGDVHLSLLSPSTPVFSSLSYTYPLKLLPSNPYKLDPDSQSHETDPSPKTTGENSPNSLHRALAPRLTAPSSVPLLFILTYGGGLLAGDCIDITMRLESYTRLTITTQGSTKVYKYSTSLDNSQQSRSEELVSTPSALIAVPSKILAFSDFDPKTISKQDLRVSIGIGAGLWIGPDPIQPFQWSRYAQKQIFEVERGGSVGLVDWVTEGRRARGETWLMDGWRGRNEIWDVVRIAGQKEVLEGKIQERKVLMVRDSVILQPDGMTGIFPSLSSEVGVIGTILLHGPLFASVSAFLLSEFAALPRIGGRDWDRALTKEEELAKEARLTDQARWRKRRYEKEKMDGLLWTAATVRGGVTVVKFAAREVEGARTWLGAILREEGSILKNFGPGGMMFVR